MKLQAAVAVATVVGVEGHGWMTEPPTRGGGVMAAGGSCAYGVCLWFNQGCTIGCPDCLGADGPSSGSCGNNSKPTLPNIARTYSDNPNGCGINPWCAPGQAPIMNPCGVAGGDIHRGKPGNGGDPPPGYKLGFPGDKVPPLTGTALKRTWKVGEAVDVAWTITANHGGGYQYRFCKKGSELNEECFQKNPLEFVGNTHDVQYCTYPEELEKHPLPEDATAQTYPPEKYFPASGCDPKNKTSIAAIDVSTGTVPKGSTWRRNPIPACKAAAGGAFDIRCGAGSGTLDSDFQFPPAGKDMYRAPHLLGGFGYGSCGGCNQKDNVPSFCFTTGPDGAKNCTAEDVKKQFFSFNVVDKVKVPNVPAGEYVVSFRWDCEQTPQIWSQCADITIVDTQDNVVV